MQTRCSVSWIPLPTHMQGRVNVCHSNSSGTTYRAFATTAIWLTKAFSEAHPEFLSIPETIEVRNVVAVGGALSTRLGRLPASDSGDSLSLIRPRNSLKIVRAFLPLQAWPGPSERRCCGDSKLFSTTHTWR